MVPRSPLTAPGGRRQAPAVTTHDGPVAVTAARRPASSHDASVDAGERWATRVFWAVALALPLVVLGIALALTPDPTGHGTHTQLGLPPCGFIVFLGIPCPGCGLTTAFSHMVRMDIAGAFAANPFGILLFLVTVASLPVSFAGVVRALPVLETLERVQLDRILLVLAVVSVGTWVVRVAGLLLGG